MKRIGISIIIFTVLVGAGILFTRQYLEPHSVKKETIVETQENDQQAEAKYIANMRAQIAEALPLAQRAETVAKHSELSALAAEYARIATDEDAQLRRWQTAWGYEQALADENRLPRYVDPKEHADMVTRLQTATGDDFDREYLTYLRNLTSTDVQLSLRISGKARHDEVEVFAKQALQTRYTLSNTMSKWPELWGYAPPHSG